VPPANDNITDIFARRFSASRGDEPCVIGNGKLWCDTGRTGGDPEVRHGFGGTSSGFGLLGDVDGDGREDPCVYTGGVFRCDTDHERGDVDGDGREDPCVYTGGVFRCDTDHERRVPPVFEKKRRRGPLVAVRDQETALARWFRRPGFRLKRLKGGVDLSDPGKIGLLFVLQGRPQTHFFLLRR
jgi:hypothetical protein